MLIESLKHESFEMPPDGQLPDEVIADFVTWIKRGAIDPRTKVRHGKLKPVDWEAAAEHWAFKEITEPVPPDYSEADRDRIKNPIDQFVLRKLRDSGFTPAAPADKRTLIRRATFDLIGLPPTVEEVQDFLNDESPGAFDKGPTCHSSPCCRLRLLTHPFCRPKNSTAQRVQGREPTLCGSWTRLSAE